MTAFLITYGVVFSLMTWIVVKKWMPKKKPKLILIKKDDEKRRSKDV